MPCREPFGDRLRILDLSGPGQNPELLYSPLANDALHLKVHGAEWHFPSKAIHANRFVLPIVGHAAKVTLEYELPKDSWVAMCS